MKIKRVAIVAISVLLSIVSINYIVDNSLLIYSTFDKARSLNAQIVSKASGKNGVVVSTQKEASEIGLQILKDGGNAIDAGVAVGYASAVSDPCCGNLGGGGFMLIHLANGKETFINFRETAPQQASADMYVRRTG